MAYGSYRLKTLKTVNFGHKWPNFGNKWPNFGHLRILPGHTPTFFWKSTPKLVPKTSTQCCGLSALAKLKAKTTRPKYDWFPGESQKSLIKKMSILVKNGQLLPTNGQILAISEFSRHIEYDFLTEDYMHNFHTKN